MIDCGCSPIGGLALLAEMAGPSGRAVGGYEWVTSPFLLDLVLRKPGT